jgi:hypothetical protein
MNPAPHPLRFNGILSPHGAAGDLDGAWDRWVTMLGDEWKAMKTTRSATQQ